MAINYTITPKNLHAHIFQIRIMLDCANPLGQVFSLPSWIPSSYLIRDFCKHIISIRAYSDNQPITLKQLDKNHWITHPCTNDVVLEYEVYAFDLSPRSAYLSNERAFFNGSSVFLTPIGCENTPCEVRIYYPSKADMQGDWSCASALKHHSRGKGFEVYTADNYQHLIDCPVEMADFTRFEFEADNTPHSMTLTGQHSTDIARLRRDLMKICQHHIDFFGGEPPFDEYLFLTLIRTKGYGGLEHKNSSSLICARQDLPTPERQELNPDYTQFLALCSHEYFHAWWVKTIKPASFHNLDLNRENYTEQLWIFEGWTSYYDELALLRTQLLSPEQYLSLFAQTLTKVQKNQGRFRQTLAQSSFDAWTKFYQQDENAPNAIVSYYTKGALLAFVLDIEIRRRSDDTQSLDTVLQFIWNNYQTYGLEDDSVQKIVEHLTQSSFEQFFANYLHDTIELPIHEAFNYVGIQCTFSHKKGDLSAFGMHVNKDLTITHIFDNTCAQSSGIYVGDTIVSIDGVQVLAKNLANIIESYAANTTIKIGILRDELPLELNATITPITPTFCTLSQQKNANKITQNRRDNWFYHSQLHKGL